MRRAAAGLALFLSLGLLYLGLGLFAAHVQIRGIEPHLPDRASLLHSVAVPDGPVSVHFLNTASQPMPANERMGHISFVLEWGDGRRLLIDAGMDREEAVAFGRPLEWLIGAESTSPHGSVAEQMGEERDLIEAVVFTHLHTDHTHGMLSLCDQRKGKVLRVFQTPHQAAERNYMTDMGYEHIAKASCSQFKSLAGGPIYSLPGFPGLVAIAAGGHTPGSTLYLARVGDQLWLFSGDITNSRTELLENRPKAFLYSLLIVPEDRGRLEILRLWLTELDRDPNLTVVVSHDLNALEAGRLPAWN